MCFSDTLMGGKSHCPCLHKFVMEVHLSFFFICCVCMCLCVCMHAYYSMYVEVKRQTVGVSSLLPLCESWGLNLGGQTWQQVSLPAGPTLQSRRHTLMEPYAPVK